MQPATISNEELKKEFQNALKLQQEKKYDEALGIYTSLLDKNPDLNPDQISDISYNAGLSAYLNKNYLQSYIYNQKALLLNPYNRAAKNFAPQIQTQFQYRNPPHDITVTENLNKLGFNYLLLEVLWLGSLIFLALLLKNITQHYVKQKESFNKGFLPPKFSLKNYVWLVFFIIFSCLTGIKVWEQLTPKALVKTDALSLRTAAGENQASLTDLPGGSLVEILRTQSVSDTLYLQIKYPGGASGWVKKDDLEIISMPK